MAATRVLSFLFNAQGVLSHTFNKDVVLQSVKGIQGNVCSISTDPSFDPLMVAGDEVFIDNIYLQSSGAADTVQLQVGIPVLEGQTIYVSAGGGGVVYCTYS